MTVIENVRSSVAAKRNGVPLRGLFTPAILAGCLLLGAIVSVWLGQDANWDLRNYHLYNGWAALHGRFEIDLAAASLQSWINPTLDIPYAWLALGPLSHHPQLLAAFMGLWYGALIAVILGIAAFLYRSWPADRRWFATIAAAILASTGAATISQVGTTFNEIQTSALVLSSVLLLIRVTGANDNAPHRIVVLVAGGLLGAAAGLKITSAIYAPAAVLAFIAVSPIRRWPASLVLLVVGGIAGFALGGGWWAYRLYETYGNPVFPFFNGVFRSPWYPPVNFFDRRFLPHDVPQALFYPFFWLSDKPMLVTEIPFRDGRVAACFALGMIVAGIAAVRALTRVTAGSRNHRPVLSLGAQQRFLLVFVAGSYVLWLGTTSILRYGIPVEVSAALVIPLLLSLLVEAGKGRAKSRVWVAALVCIALALVASTRYPQWGRTAFEKPVISADMSWVRPHALVVFVGAPIAYVAPFVPAGVAASFVGLTDVVFESRGYRLANEVVDRIRWHRGPIYIIWTTPDEWRLPSLPDMGLREVGDSCRTFYGKFEAENHTELHECLAIADSETTLRSAFWRRAAAQYDEVEVPERPVPGWSYAGFLHAVGKAALGKKYVDDFEYLWSREATRPKQFDQRILPHTLYVLNPVLEDRAERAMNRSADLLTKVDGVLVLAPGWKSRAQNDYRNFESAR
ncbi:MAG: hypothetical protein ACREHF_14530 [Rhizomicrobium sp.]